MVIVLIVLLYCIPLVPFVVTLRYVVYSYSVILPVAFVIYFTLLFITLLLYYYCWLFTLPSCHTRCYLDCYHVYPLVMYSCIVVVRWLFTLWLILFILLAFTFYVWFPTLYYIVVDGSLWFNSSRLVRSLLPAVTFIDSYVLGSVITVVVVCSLFVVITLFYCVCYAYVAVIVPPLPLRLHTLYYPPLLLCAFGCCLLHIFIYLYLVVYLLLPFSPFPLPYLFCCCCSLICWIIYLFDYVTPVIYLVIYYYLVLYLVLIAVLAVGLRCYPTLDSFPGLLFPVACHPLVRLFLFYCVGYYLPPSTWFPLQLRSPYFWFVVFGLRILLRCTPCITHLDSVAVYC